MNATTAFLETTGMPSMKDNAENAKALFPYDDGRHQYMEVGGHRIVAWGRQNDFPNLAVKLVRETTVLNTGLKFIRNFTMGQGIYACRVKGYDDDGNELLEPYTDTKVQQFVSSRQTRRTMEALVRDYLKVGSGCVQFVPDASGKIIGLNTINSLHFRHTVPDKYGRHDTVVSAYYPTQANAYDYDVLPALSEFNPEEHADMLLKARSLKKGFVMPVRDSWSNDPVYSEPIWLPAFVCGWVDIAHMVPMFLKRAYRNQITWKWHVQIPYSYWDKRYPAADFKDPKMRERKIQEDMDAMERNLCGMENAEKPLFTHYAVNEMNGKVEEEWKITALDNKYKGGENLVTSAAANSEILFAIMSIRMSSVRASREARTPDSRAAAISARLSSSILPTHGLTDRTFSTPCSCSCTSTECPQTCSSDSATPC